MISTMIQVKVKLSAFEVWGIQHVMKYAAERELRADMKNDTIILAENYHTWLKRYISADKSKPRTYTLPLSTARILHLRLQQLPTCDAYQSLLGKLDQALTNLSMKPPFQTVLL